MIKKAKAANSGSLRWVLPEDKNTLKSKKNMAILTAVIGIMCFFIISSAGANQYSVCSVGCNFSTLTEALENITGTPNSTLIINESGSYSITNKTTYYINDSFSLGAVFINASGVLLDCNGSNITGHGVGYGIYAYKSSIEISNCWAGNYTRGIYIRDSSDGARIANSVVHENSAGIYISNSSNTIIENCSIYTPTSSALLFASGALNNTFKNSRIYASLAPWDIRSLGNGTQNTILNSNFDESKLSFEAQTNSSINVKWIVDFLVNDTDSNPVENAVVNISDAYSTLLYSLITNESGLTDSRDIVQYMENASGRTYYSNHSIIAYNETRSAFLLVNITSNMTIALTFDLEPPIITINSPQNNTNLTNSTAYAIAGITTNKEAACRYNLTNSDFDYYNGGVLMNTTDNIAHWFNYTGLVNGTTYTIYYKCNDSNANINPSSAVHVFHINQTVDDTAPVIVLINSTVTNQSAVIYWETDDLANYTLNYGPNTSMLQEPAADSGFSNTHEANLSTLLSNTTYYYNITTCNSNNKCAEYGPYNFTTNETPDLSAPVISQIRNSTINIYNATITWETDEPATSLVRYATSSGTYAYNETNSSFSTSHSIMLSGLSASTTYYYAVNSTDLSGNSAQSSEYSFTTQDIPDTTPPVIAFSWNNLSTINDWKNILLSVSTDEAATCDVDSYKLGTTTSTTDIRMTPSTNNRTHSKYFNATADSSGFDNYFTVKCTDSSSNTASSRIYFKVNDTTLPSLSFSSPTPSNGGYTNNRTLTVTVTAGETPYANYPQISVDGASFTAMTSQGSLVYTYSKTGLSESEHSFTVVMKDPKGNVQNYTRTFIVDITEPEIDIIEPTGSTIKNTNSVNINVSMDEDGTCDYEIYSYRDDRYTRCTDRCERDYDRCFDGAETSAEKTACRDERNDCNEDCKSEEYGIFKTGPLKMTYSVDDCYDVCSDFEKDCKDDCSIARGLCYVSAKDSDDRDDCRDDYDDCLDDCEDDFDDCGDDCDDENQFYFFKALDNVYFDDNDYIASIICYDLAGNYIIENISFDVLDTTPPEIISATPNGTQQESSVTIRAYTNENAKCRFSEYDKAFAEMEYSFPLTGTSHSFTLNSLEDGDYIYYIRCNDTKGNVMTGSKKLEFGVEAAGISVIGSSKTFESVKANTTEKFYIEKEGIAVTELELISTEDVENVKLSVSQITDTISISAPDDDVYQFLKIEKEGISNTQIEKIILRFKVSKSWINMKAQSADNVYLGKYTTRWGELETRKLSEDSEYYYYQSQTGDLSTFAILAKKPLTATPGQQTGTDAQTGAGAGGSGSDSTGTADERTPVADDEPREITKSKIAWWIWILVFCALAAVAGGIFSFVYTHRHPQQDSKSPLKTQPAQDSMAAAETDSAAAFFSNEKEMQEKSRGNEITGTKLSGEQSEGLSQEIKDYVLKANQAGMKESEIIAALVNTGHEKSSAEAHVKNALGKLDSNNSEKEGSNKTKDAQKSNDSMQSSMQGSISIQAGSTDNPGNNSNAGFSRGYGNYENNYGSNYNDNYGQNKDNYGQANNYAQGYNETANSETANEGDDLQRYEKSIGDYIKNAQEAGLSPEEIKKALIDAGNDKDYISQKIESELKNASGLKNNLANGKKIINEKNHGPEIDKELYSYIEKCMAENISKGIIIRLLVKAGHDKKEVEKIIKIVKKRGAQKKPN